VEIMAHEILETFKDINEEFIAKEKILTKLDNKIGDGDHGSNMKRGFEHVIKELIYEDENDLKNNFEIVGKTLMSKVGGASGPLYGMAFINGATHLQGQV